MPADSKNVMPHDTRITMKRDFPSRNLNFRWPEQANVMQRTEALSRKMVFISTKAAWRPAWGIEIQRRVAGDLARDDAAGAEIGFVGGGLRTTAVAAGPAGIGAARKIGDAADP